MGSRMCKKCRRFSASTADGTLSRRLCWALHEPRRSDMNSPLAAERLICDLTQSWSDVGGGVGTYLRHKRAHILKRTPHRHLLIVPGPRTW